MRNDDQDLNSIARQDSKLVPTITQSESNDSQCNGDDQDGVKDSSDSLELVNHPINVGYTPIVHQNPHNLHGFSVDGVEPLTGKHLGELAQSAIAHDVAALNFFSLDGERSIDWVLGDKVAPDSPHRRNDGRLREGILKIADSLNDGGWGFETVDNNGNLTGWGQLKPDTSRLDHKGKVVKYESIHSKPSGLILLRYPERIKPDDSILWITEGAKKTAALMSAYQSTVGLNGIYGWKRNHEILPQLAELAKGKTVIIALDQDTKTKTRRIVKKAKIQLAKELEKLGCKVYQALWSINDGKGIDDVLASGKGLDEIALAPIIDCPYNGLREADTTVNSRYLNYSDLAIPIGKKLIAVKSPKGTGKTFGIIKPYIDNCLDCGDKPIGFTHRVGLGQDLASKVSVPYFRDSVEEGLNLGYIITADSLHCKSSARITPEDLDGKVIIVDEFMQFLWHVLSSTTEVKKHRVEIINNIKHAFKTAKQVVILDADLNNVGIDLVQKWMGIDDEQTCLIVNDYIPQAPDVTVYDDSKPDGMMLDLYNHIKEGGKPVIFTVGQKESSKYGTRNLAKKLRKDFPHLSVGVIDSESKKIQDDPAHNATENINDWISVYDILIYSPSIGTGVSIDIVDKYDSAWGLAFGCISPDSFRQALARLRESVQRFIWVGKTGLNNDYVGNGATNYESVYEQVKQAKTASTKRYHSTLSELLLIDHKLGEMSDETLTAWCKIVASRNYGFSHYRDSVIDGLISEGSSVKRVKTEKGYAKAFSKDMKLNRDDALNMSAKNISESNDKNDEEIKALSEQTSLKNKAEYHELEKGRIKQKYGLDVTPELVLKDKDGWGEKIRHHYRINHGFTNCPNFGNKTMIDVLEQLKSKFDHDGIAFTPDVANRHKGARLAVILKELGIDYILGLDFLRGDDPTLAEINAIAIERRKEIKIVAGISIGEKNKPIQTAQSLLNILGLKSPYLRREGAKDEQVRIYGKPCPDYERSINANGKQTKAIVNPDTGNIIPINDERDLVFAHWLERDTEKIKGLRVVYDHEQTIIAKAKSEQDSEYNTNNQKSMIDLKAIKSLDDYAVALNQWGLVAINEELPKQLSDDHDKWQCICDWANELNNITIAQSESMAIKFVQFTRNAFKRLDKFIKTAFDEHGVEIPDYRTNQEVSHWGNDYAICCSGLRVNEGEWVGVYA